MGRILAAITMVLALALLASCSNARVIPERDASRPVSREGATTIVRRGDTLYGIAFRNGLDYRDVAAWNGIRSPYTIYPGQRLRLSGSGGARATAPVATRPARQPDRRPPATAATPRPPVATPPAGPASHLRWSWPAEGQLINRFAAGDPTRQGIDIAGKRGDPVRAAADGVVVYSGAGLVGYGELVIVKHDESWLSAYGHNRSRLVAEGARVRAGQQIAEMGRTGADRDMLHFEIRRDGKPVDPLRHLPAR